MWNKDKFFINTEINTQKEQNRNSSVRRRVRWSCCSETGGISCHQQTTQALGGEKSFGEKAAKKKIIANCLGVAGPPKC